MQTTSLRPRESGGKAKSSTRASGVDTDVGIEDATSFINFLNNCFSEHWDELAITQKKMIDQRPHLLASRTQEGIKTDCINLSNQGLNDLELIKIVLPIIEGTLSGAKWHAIDLSFNLLTPLCIRELIRVLNVASSHGIAIRRIHLDGNNLLDSGVTELSSGLNKAIRASIEDLTLGMNRVGAPGASSLAHLLENSKMKKIVLDGNPIGNEGIIAITKALGGKDLCELSLRDTQMTEAGCCVLAEGIQRCGNLRHLSLAQNKISDVGVMAIARSIEKHAPGVKSLDIADCNLTIAGIKSMIPAVKASALVEINLGGVRFSEDSLEVVNELQRLVKFKSSQWFQTMQALLASRQAARLAKPSPVSSLPTELIRYMGSFIPQSETKPHPDTFAINLVVNMFPIVLNRIEPSDEASSN